MNQLFNTKLRDSLVYTIMKLKWKFNRYRVSNWSWRVHLN